MAAEKAGRVEEDFLDRVNLFRELPAGEMARLKEMAKLQAYPANQVIFREGDPVDALYVVAEGAVAVFRDAKGKPLQLLARLEEGSFFGEMGLLNKTRRLASARTTAPTVLLRIAKQDLLDLLSENPNLELKFRAEIIRRHGLNVSALLGLAGQRDVRIRLGVEAVVETVEGASIKVVLENLSLGGVAISGAPPSWRRGTSAAFTLGRPGEPGILPVNGLISWREGDTVGIAFDPVIVGDDSLIHRAIRRFLEPGG